MDLAQLSNEVTLALAPFLPTLLAVGGKVVEGIENKIGEDAWDKVKTLWSKLRPKVEANPFAKRAVQEVAAAPDDKDLLAVMRAELKKILAADQNFAHEVSKIWIENKNIITNAVASGDQNAVFAGPVSDSLVNTGSGAVFNITHNHPVSTSVARPQNPEPAKHATKLSPLNQLPPVPANFTGRDEDLAELEKELASAHMSGATISAISRRHAGLQGMGGVGKTALATVLAHRLMDRYPDAQLYLNLRGADPDHRPPVAPADAMQSLIHVFHPEARLPEALDQLTPVYHGVLNDAGRVLLFLDNAADAAQVRPLLPPAHCLLLVTSRNHFSLPGLATRNIDCLPPAESQELLRKLSSRIKGFEKDAAELCGHLPLALEVFAGVVEENNTYPVPDLLERLRQLPAQLTKAEAAFQVSYDLLAADLRRRWTALAVFPASFELRAAIAVWEKVAQASAPAGSGGVPAAIADAGPGGPPNPQAGTPALLADSARAAMQALVNASLVEWNEADGRYRLHDLVRQFCHGKLNEVERTALHLAHARHYTAVGYEAHELYTTKGKHVDGLALFDRERVQMEAAYAWLDAQVGRVTPCAPDLDKATSSRRAEDCPPYLPKDLEAAARQMIALVNAVAYTSDLRFHPRQRIAWLESQLRAARILKDRSNEGVALGNLGLAHADLGDARKAIEFYEQQLVIVREIGDRRGEGNALEGLAISHRALGDTSKGISYHEQSVVLYREIGDRRGEGNALWNSALAHDSLGNRAEAIARAEATLKIFEAIEDPNAAKVRAALAEWRAAKP